MALGFAAVAFAAMQTVSDSDGNYSFSGDFAPGVYRLDFTHAGYASSSVEVQVRDGNDAVAPPVLLSSLATATPSQMPSSTPTDTQTPIPTMTSTDTHTSTPTETSTPTLTMMPTETPTVTPTYTPPTTSTVTPTLGNTHLGPALVWLDTNEDGIYNNELGWAGVTVTLYTSSGIFVGTSVTDNNGFYGFYNLEPGNYYLEFEDPTTIPGADERWTYTVQDVGGDDNIDSDAENAPGATYGQTAPFTLAPGETRTNIMAGYDPQVVQLEDATDHAGPAGLLTPPAATAAPAMLPGGGLAHARLANPDPGVWTVPCKACKP